MIEIFLFINPLGIACYRNEKEIMTAIEQSNKKVHYHFVPITNIGSVRTDLKRRGYANPNLTVHNVTASNMYNALKDFHSLSFMGSKKARDFLLRIQQEINENKHNYSKELVNAILDELEINKNVFEKNRDSQFISDAIEADYKLANEFDIKETPTTVIYNYDAIDTCGIAYQGCLESNVIKQIIDGEISFVDTVNQVKETNPENHTLRVL